MVRFINKALKAHSCEINENLSNIFDIHTKYSFSELLRSHLSDFTDKSVQDMNHLLKKINIHLSVSNPTQLISWINSNSPKIKDLFLLIELILETYIDSHKRWLQEGYIFDFIEDINEFFLINKIGLQIRYFSKNKEFYIEKIINPEVSEKIKETLNNFSEDEKVFEDFKNAIKKFSSGNYEESIEKCCVSIEDYLCIILNKQTCSSVDTYYKEVSKKLKIPLDLDDRFSNLINYIHKYRSNPNHGSIEKKEMLEPELTSATIIQFTMAILNYLKKKNESNLVVK